MLLTAFVLSILPVIYGEHVVTLAVVLFRHGDRTPIDFYPTDPWANQSYWPVRFGELTPTGVEQHYALGQWLRERYSDLLSDDYDPVQITVKSTDIDRTLMSAQANLAGLFPPEGKFLWNPKLPWQPIPIHTVPYNQDEVLSMGRNCSAYNKALNRFTSTDDFKTTLHSYQGLMDYLTASTGKIVKDYKGIEYVFNTLSIESLYNYTLPNWTHSVYPEKMIVPATYNFVIPTATPLLARLRVGPLIKQIATNMKEVADMRSPTKMLMYSAHDDTVAAVLNSLGLFEPASMPAYTATVIMELLNDNSTGGNYVRISYRNSAAIVEPEILSIPYCGQTCPLERFLQLYRNLVTFGDWSTECEPQFPHFLGMSFYVGLGLIFFIYMCHRTFLPGLYTGTGACFGYSTLRQVNPDNTCTVKTTIVMHA